MNAQSFINELLVDLGDGERNVPIYAFGDGKRNMLIYDLGDIHNYIYNYDLYHYVYHYYHYNYHFLYYYFYNELLRSCRCSLAAGPACLAAARAG
jgi:hypothetical protein